MKYPAVQHYIGGTFVDGSPPFGEVHDPSTGQLLAKVPLGGKAEVDAAVQGAKRAFPAWSKTPIKERAQVFYRYRALLEKNIKELSDLIVEEHGKIYSEAEAEVLKAMELTEFACSLPQLAGGEVLEVSRGVECRIERLPLGVVAAIVPFNFPSMVPHWSIPNAIALGNCLVLKPSERVPLSSRRIAELLREAGLPAGVFSLVQGSRDVVEALCDHPDIAALSFVGSTAVAKAVYRRGTNNLKRVLALGGAKNHLIVLPDADPEMTSSNVLASATGCAGQRCMAASVMVALPRTDHIIEKVAGLARKMTPGKELGPVISQAARDRIVSYIDEAERDGASVLVDGRQATVAGKEGGYWLGPTVVVNVRPEMKIVREEVFGPVLAVLRTETLDEALAVENASPYGNAASIYTENGGLARYVTERASAGMVGINVGVPVPREPFSFGGWNDSKFGVGDLTGKSSVEFWTQLKKTTTKWNREAGSNWMS